MNLLARLARNLMLVVWAGLWNFVERCAPIIHDGR
jgi:hypothetical protein